MAIYSVPFINPSFEDALGVEWTVEEVVVYRRSASPAAYATSTQIYQGSHLRFWRYE